jgi:hypothetical protein
MKKLVFTFVTLVFCLSLPAWAQKNITIQEQDQVVAGGGSQCDADGSLAANCGWEVQPPFTSWTRSGDPSFTGICSSTVCFESGLGAVAHSGNWALVTGPDTSLGCVEQNIPTDSAALYDLTFYLRNMGSPNRFQVSWDGNVIYDQSNMLNFPYTSSDALPGDTSVFIGLTPSEGETTNLKFCFFNPPNYFFLDDVDVLAE